jgi:glycosyl hydrolase family 113
VRPLATLGALALLALAARARQEPGEAGLAGEPGVTSVPANGESWALFQGLARVRRIDLDVPPGPCEAAAKDLAARLGASGRFTVSTDSTDSGARDPDALRVRVGLASDAALAPLAVHLGLEPAAQGFRLLGREWSAPGDALVAVFEDPVRDGRPIVLVLGNDPDMLAAYLDGLPRATRPHLWVHADGELALECPLALDGTPRAEEVVDYAARRAAYFAEHHRQEFEGLVVNVHGELERERWKSYGLALAGARKRTLEWLGTPDEAVPVVELYLYSHHEDFERCLGRSALSVVNRLRPQVHALLVPGAPDDGGIGLARALARALAGAPAAPWIEDGFAVAAADLWWGRPLGEWLAHLVRARLLPPPDWLVTNDGRLSEHVLQPARALLVLELLRDAKAEPRKVRALWKGAGTDARTVSTLYRRGAETAGRPGERPGAMRPSEASEETSEETSDEAGGETPFRHGLALVASEGAGYGSRRLDEALAAAGELAPGPDAVSLTLRATGEDPRAPLLDPHPLSSHATTSDAALASAVAAARARGLAVLVSLEVLSYPSGAWADVISWTGADDNERFFERYTRVALHQALTCELLGVELFSFGSNLRESTRTEVDEDTRDPRRLEQRLELRKKGWQSLLARLRAAYLGDLTFAARFPGEAQEVGFYDRLDYLSVVFFPPLMREPGTPEPALLARTLRYQLEQAFDLAVRWNRPLLLLQTGFPARSDSWQRPQTPRGTPDPAAQRAFLEALAGELHARHENGAVLRGFFLWNWPLDAGRADASGFSLRGLPDETALRRLLER